MNFLNDVLNIMISIDLNRKILTPIIIFDYLMKNEQVYDSYDDKIEMLKQIKTCKARMLKWNKDQKQWIEIQHLTKAQPHSLQSIRTFSFNVLFDRLHQLGRKGCMEHVLHSKQRFAYTLKQIQEMDPDIVGLQEVTQVFFKMLLQCEWAKKKYWISNNLKYNQGFGNVLMSKIQPICIVPMKIKSLPRMAWTGFFPLKAQTTQIFTFTSVHLIALDKNSDIRSKQFQDLIRNLNQYSKIVQDNVIQGDLNFHAQIETETGLKHGLTDSWLERCQGNLKQYPGYTFNSDKNSLINELYWGFQRRKMRLDRIFYLGNIFFTADIQIVFDKSLKNQHFDEGQNVDKHMFLKGGFLYVGDYFGWNIRQDMERKLFASDHFGLLATLKFKGKSQINKRLIV